MSRKSHARRTRCDSHEPRMQQLSDDFARLGLNPFHVPLGVRLDETNRRKSPCIRCATCDGHPCLINAKSDAQVLCVDPALEYPNVSLVTEARVTRLETDASGHTVKRVLVERSGTMETYSADVVVVSAGAINPALLLRSANDKHPSGLANGSDVVGRHYMVHVNSVLMAISKCPNPTVFQKTLALNDFYFGSKEWEFPMGHISFVGKLDTDTLRAGAPAITPGFVLETMAEHSLDFWLTSEDLPDPNNRVTLDRDGNIVLSYNPNNEEGHKRLIAKLKELMKQQTRARFTARFVIRGFLLVICTSVSAFRLRALLTRMGRSVSAMTQGRRHSTGIARHTSWTISTLWTRVFSHRAVR